MGRDFYQAYGVARRIYDQADSELGFPLSRICFEGPEERLNATDIAQLAIFVTSVAIFETLLELKRLPGKPSFAAGLSLGEFTALHLAGVLSFNDALRAIRNRGRLMQAAAEAAPSTMLALVGASETDADEICRKAAAQVQALSESDRIVVPANYNAPGQIVLSGSVPACKEAALVAEAGGFRSIPLKVAGAFHSPFMASACEPMAEILRETVFSPPRMPVISNVTGEPHGDSESIRALLVQQIVSPVRWYQSIATLQKLGAAGYLEVGPGRVLTGLMRKIDRTAKIVNISAAEDLSTAA